MVAPDTKVIVLTGQNDRSNALRAIELGAYDFFEAVQAELLAFTIERAFRLHDLQQENRRLRLIAQPNAFEGLLSRDPEMLRICRTIEKVASSSATVLLLGESGTGKEVLARGLHQTTCLLGPVNDLLRSTAPRSRKTCWRASSSDMKKVGLPALQKRLLEK